MPADLLAGCSGTEWNPKDPLALITDCRCCSESMWRDRLEPGGSDLGLLITQRSRVQIPPGTTSELERVTDGDDAGAQGDLLAGQPVGIAGTVEAFVGGVHRVIGQESG
jgi:hypothetical protein